MRRLGLPIPVHSLIWFIFAIGSLASVVPAFAQLATPSQPVTNAIALIPEPRELTNPSQISIGSGIAISIETADLADRFTVADLIDAAKDRGVRAELTSSKSNRASIEFLKFDSRKAHELLDHARLTFDEPMQTEGYAIVPTKEGLAIIAATSEGLFYGAQTVKQLIVGDGPNALLKIAVIRDWPAMRYRGMDDDLSRGPVPTLDFQKKQIRTFAAYKLNIYSPYFENTFRYRSNPLAASPGGAMTHADYAELVRYAQQYHVTVVPEQEAFGHLHNVLSYEQYTGLAETPHGSVLAPGNSAVLPLIKDWFTELAAETPGPFLHIGGDETVDLGRGKTHAEVQRRGLGPVYIDFLKSIDETLAPLNKRILFWGDVAVSEPKLVPQLPKNMIAVPWDYDISDTGYEHEIKPFTDAGMETWIAPGVNNWNRVYPNDNVALRNIQGFIRDGQHLGSTGALTTAWDDDGEGLFNQDWYGVLFAAAASWQPGESSIPAYQQKYGQAFHGDRTGNINLAQEELMAAHALLDPLGDGGATDRLFWVDPWSPDGRAVAPKIKPVLHDLRLHAERAIVLIAKAQDTQSLREVDALSAMELGARRIDLIGMKFQIADEIASAYRRGQKAQIEQPKTDDVDNALYEISDTNGRCQDVRNTYSLTRDLFEQSWLKENRPFWLHNVLTRYDEAIELWSKRGETFAAAQNQWHRDHTLPPSESLGIPPEQ